MCLLNELVSGPEIPWIPFCFLFMDRTGLRPRNTQAYKEKQIRTVS